MREYNTSRLRIGTRSYDTVKEHEKDDVRKLVVAPMQWVVFGLGLAY